MKWFRRERPIIFGPSIFYVALLAAAGVVLISQAVGVIRGGDLNMIVTAIGLLALLVVGGMWWWGTRDEAE